MKVTFLGTGTSQGVPMIACDCPVCQSTDPRDKRLRSSVFIEVKDKQIVIDTGPDFRYQMLRENVKRLDAVLFTHMHKDHIAGLDDIRAFNYRQGKAVDIYADELVQEALKREFYYIFSAERYPGVPQVEMHLVEQLPFSIGDVCIQPIDVMHYKLPIKGYRIGDFTYLTDVKTVSEASRKLIKGSKILVVNALQREPHISHFTLSEAIAFAKEIGAEQTYLTHIGHRMGKYIDVSMELPSNIHLAYDRLELEL
ncbi:MBL fold metallo-hydrolase [Olivibacter sitiensis]|uniref:MBL fold metallo-hydrolase n=1 Tax=Olivibacter sitiensis TaxID=376470 RepID=UPI0004828210|nr:MBL fold metallo-hydrolase [Olivibacter sitiensis]